MGIYPSGAFFVHFSSGFDIMGREYETKRRKCFGGS